MSFARPITLPDLLQHKFRLAVAMLLALGLLACSSSDEAAVSPFQGTGIGISTADLDTTIDPGNDFFEYANGKWLAAAQIPEGANAIGRQSRAKAELERRLTTIVEDIAGRPQDAGTPEAVVRDYYRQFMDRAAINRQGISPAMGDIRRFQNVGDLSALSEVIGGTLRADASPMLFTESRSPNLFSVAALPAPDDGQIVPWLFAGGLGLPQRADYLAETAQARSNRAAYRDYVARILSLAGLDEATERANGVLALETSLAEAQGEAVPDRDRLASAAVWSRDELEERAPGLDWSALLSSAGLGSAERIAVLDPQSVAAMSALAGSEPIEAWRDWLVFHRLSSHANVLPDDFGSAHFAFHGRRLDQRARPEPLEQQAVAQIGTLFTDTMSRLYAERYFSSEEKRDVEIIAERVRDALVRKVQDDPDLGDEAKDAAARKLEQLTLGIAYPESYNEIEELRAVGNNAYAKTIAAERAAYAREIAAVGQEKRGRWRTGAHRMQAVYLPLQNAINVPAAILQPPFYDPEADAAANYGSIGTIIGREMSRAVDRTGTMIDADLRIADWLAPSDRAALDERTRKLAGQFGEYRSDPNLAVDGEGTSDDDGIDLAGLVAAYDAYRASLDGREPRVIEGYTGDQRFFIAFAQLWASKLREPYARTAVESGQATLPRYRVSTVRNVDAWYRAFDVQNDDALYLPPGERVTIW
ncbi:M13 family metallopeptidase [Croceicoccus marinus]|uniref:M13 family metallopeptidase n=1 Tax=Croceicoccus marinus TaxID=450378 RepID=A0A7G6VR70_9SPHN|nr:M13 family metallopeptidase [Croceicoccus marinus]QNE04235.1 M13 family metallopeptidase [Croceicoccus marinus]